MLNHGALDHVLFNKTKRKGILLFTLHCLSPGKIILPFLGSVEMPQILQAVESYGLHEGMNKEVSVSACPECVEGTILMRTKWPE